MKYFIGHKSFSDLMEEMVERKENLIGKIACPFD